MKQYLRKGSVTVCAIIELIDYVMDKELYTQVLELYVARKQA